MDVKVAINRKLRFRYSSLITLLISYFIAIFLLILNIFIHFNTINVIFFTGFIIIFLLSIILLFVSKKKSPLPAITSIDEMKGYLEYFKNSKIKPFVYGDVIIWFSQVVHSEYIKKEDSDAEAKDYILIIKHLHQVLRLEKHDLCLAFYHQEAFAELSSKIVEAISNNTIQDRIADIDAEIRRMQNNPPEEKHKPNKDKNMIYYISLITFHIIGCFFVAEIFTNFSLSIFLGNIFLYIPTDIGLIIIYKGIIKGV